ncbi:SMI1/KNR4 family protein [Labilibaculum euxinus]
MEINHLEKKIKELGGTKKSPTCQKSEDVNLFLREFENELNVNLPDLFRKFHASFGAFSFNNPIQVRCKDLPVTSKDEYVKVDYFYCFDMNCKHSIQKIIEHQEGHLPKGYIPFCDGEPGDLICLCVAEENYGEIYYWWHESSMEHNLFKIANDFGRLIAKLQVRDESIGSQEELKKVTIKAKPKLLDLLKKSGYGPKSNG